MLENHSAETGPGEQSPRNCLPTRASGRLVTVNAAAVGSEPFWQSLGFISELRNGHTHVILEIPGLGR